MNNNLMNRCQKNNLRPVGNLSIETSQGYKVYDADYLAPTIIAGTHGYAIGFIIVNDNKK